ncbi:hypothetical protein HK105_207005 [Polyrhizophydium stewartii]|uniref:Uncharacterized protein n=1 Tax=Polyrhizophydium stewartii TaxID=2732419 RepID=A0ABR4N200_9FUNG
MTDTALPVDESAVKRTIRSALKWRNGGLSPDLEVWAGSSSARAAAAAAAAVLAATDANVASDAGSNAADADADARRFDNLAVAVKSGRDVAADRVPIQMLTFLRGVSNVVLIGEAAGVRVGALEMVDVYSGLYGRLNVSDPLAGQLADAARRARADQLAGQAQRSDSGGGGDAAAQAVTEAATTVDESTPMQPPGIRE